MPRASISAILVSTFLIITGLVLILNLSVNYVWSMILILLGLTFEFGAFGKSAGRFIPGGILTTIGLLFLFCTIMGFSYMSYLWPIFVVAPAIGMIQTYIVNRNKGILVASTVLFGIGAVLFGISLYQWKFVRVIFGITVIVFGIILLTATRKK